MAVVWFCPDRGCNPAGPEAEQARTASFGESPVCQFCGANMEWRPA